MPALGTWAAPIYNEVPAQEFSPFKTVDFTFTASADDGSVPDLVLSADVRAWMAGKSFYMIETIPGSTGPTAATAVTLEDSKGDLLGGAVTIAASARQICRPIVNGKEDIMPYDGRALTLKVASNSVHSAVATIRLFMWR